MSRDGPGLLLRDLRKAEAPDIAAAIDTIVAARPDILVLQGIDYDYGGVALGALRDRIAAAGLTFDHQAQPRPNTGVPSGIDLDGDGRRDGGRDAQGYGTFPGMDGIAVLSRWPVSIEQDFTDLLWRDLPESLIAPDDPGADLQRLSTTAHVVLRVDPPDAPPLRLATFHATPPVFDGPEDRNGRRNRDETALWSRWLDGDLGPVPDGRFVILGDANADPLDGDGLHEAIVALMADPRLRDPAPQSPEGARRAAEQGGANTGHRGDPALDTTDWDDGPGQPGNLRVDYVLPSSDWTVTGAGIVWPPVPERTKDGRTAPRHGLVWVDLAGDPGAGPNP